MAKQRYGEILQYQCAYTECDSKRVTVGHFCQIVLNPENQRVYILKFPLSSSYFFQNYRFQKFKPFGSRSSLTNVGPDLGPHCLQKLSADDTDRQRDQHHDSEVEYLYKDHYR